MQELIRLKESVLVAVNLLEIFPNLKWHELVGRAEVTSELVDKLGLKPVTEQDIAEYAALTRNNPSHWPFGEGRRFFMAPIIKEEGGTQVNYCGPYEDCGEEGFELGLWRSRPRDPSSDKPERFPQTVRHPVQLAYRALSTIVAKRSV